MLRRLLCVKRMANRRTVADLQPRSRHNHIPKTIWPSFWPDGRTELAICVSVARAAHVCISRRIGNWEGVRDNGTWHFRTELANFGRQIAMGRLAAVREGERRITCISRKLYE